MQEQTKPAEKPKIDKPAMDKKITDKESLVTDKKIVKK
jgi:hypothetical protein